MQDIPSTLSVLVSFVIMTSPFQFILIERVAPSVLFKQAFIGGFLHFLEPGNPSVLLRKLPSCGSIYEGHV
jgi:hypothetical protein